MLSMFDYVLDAHNLFWSRKISYAMLYAVSIGSILMQVETSNLYNLCLSVFVRACVGACVSAWVRACVRACVSARSSVRTWGVWRVYCVRVCAYACSRCKQVCLDSVWQKVGGKYYKGNTTSTKGIQLSGMDVRQASRITFQTSVGVLQWCLLSPTLLQKTTCKIRWKTSPAQSG